MTNAADIAEAAAAYDDVQVVINNAGITKHGALADPATTQAIRDVLDINTFGTIAVTQAFAPILKRNGGGAVVNILSVLSWVSLPNGDVYHISKAAALVVAVHPGYIDTDMTAGIDAPQDHAAARRERSARGARTRSAGSPCR